MIVTNDVKLYIDVIHDIYTVSPFRLDTESDFILVDAHCDISGKLAAKYDLPITTVIEWIRDAIVNKIIF